MDAEGLGRKASALLRWVEERCSPSGREKEVVEWAARYIQDGWHFLREGRERDASLAFDYAYGLLDALLIIKGRKEEALQEGL